jgi:hypothetical protein
MMFQAWLVQRVVREVLPLVVDTVRAQLRNRQAAAAGEAAAQAPAINPETEARFTALQDDMRKLERGLVETREEFTRGIDRLLLWNRVLGAGMIALLAAVLYLLFR